MFTGLIEEVGVLSGISKGSKSCILTVQAQTVLEGSRIGDSIAVNGVCLTVTEMGATYFMADVMAETLDRSGLGALGIGSRVNLERAMPADGRFGGHIVSGHIDGTGTIRQIEREDTAVWYTVEASERVLRYIVEKGSVTIDGISLTVAKVSDTDFKVSIIPHTQGVTTLQERKTGDCVNLECDVIGKYVEKMMGLSQPQEGKKKSGVTEAFLRENGF